MLYGFARTVMSTALRIFYRRVYLTGLNNIPASGPAILIANHTSSLMDAAILGILIKRPVHAFARGDVFSKPLAARVLGALNMIPVHQHVARDSLHTNEESFVKAQELLASQLVLYFPEGNSHIERRLDTFRKGIFRLAFQSAKSYDFTHEIPIIPIGINYSHATAYQSDILLNIGAPVLISDYKNEYLANPSAALLHLTRDCYSALRKEVLHVDSKANYFLAESCLVVKRNDHSVVMSRWLQAGRRRFEEEEDICSCINQLSATGIEALHPVLSGYFGALERHRLADAAMSPSFRPLPPAFGWVLTAGLPLFVAGYLLNALPILIARRIADTKVYRVDYYSWVFVASAAFMHLLWLLALFFIYGLVAWKYAFAACLLALGTGAFALRYAKKWKHFRLSVRKNKMTQNEPGIFQKLLEDRTLILQMIDTHRNRPLTTVDA